MKTAVMLTMAAVLVLAAARIAPAGEPVNFGGNGVAWVEMVIGGGTYWDNVNNDTLSKDWETPDGSRRFTQPGNAEGNASGNSVIEYYPCPGTQVYPGDNR